jgi:hypothetical protein
MILVIIDEIKKRALYMEDTSPISIIVTQYQLLNRVVGFS